MEIIHLNEEETTSSSRIFIKILFQELAEFMGLKKLRERLNDPFMQEIFMGLFPRDNPRNTRFSINFFYVHRIRWSHGCVAFVSQEHAQEHHVKETR